jgi:hypothetical protein
MLAGAWVGRPQRQTIRGTDIARRTGVWALLPDGVLLKVMPGSHADASGRTPTVLLTSHRVFVRDIAHVGVQSCSEPGI